MCFKHFFINSHPKTARGFLYAIIRVAELPFQKQRIVALGVNSAGVLRPLPAFHTAVGSIIYFANRFYRYKKRIAAKPEMVQRIGDQLLLHRRCILLPFALQFLYARGLHVGVHPAGRQAQSRKQKDESQKANAKNYFHVLLLPFRGRGDITSIHLSYLPA